MRWNQRFALREFRKNSLWLVPVAAAVVLIGAQRVVSHFDQYWDPPEGLTFTPSTATAMLGAIITASISLIGFLLTILVLVVQISGSAYSPRTLLFIFRNQQLKLSIGAFIGTLAFAFMSMGEITSTQANDLSVLICGLLSLFSLLFFLQNLSQVMKAIRPVNLAQRIAVVGHRVIGQCYPETAPREPAAPYRQALPDGPPTRIVRYPGTGNAVLAVDIGGLARLATAHDALIVMPVSPGDFLRTQGEVFEIYGGETLPGDAALLGHLATGSERTPEQDPALALRVIVDMSIKALSPAINDPTTGEQMLDRVEDLLVDLVQRDLDTGVVRDARSMPRVVYPTPSWDDFLRLGVTEIRLYGGTNPQICRRLAALLQNLLEVAPPYRRTAIVQEQARLRRTIEQNFPDPLDRAIASIPDTQGLGATDLPESPES